MPCQGVSKCNPSTQGVIPLRSILPRARRRLPLEAEASTGITLKNKDNSTVTARTIEWAGSDLESKYAITAGADISAVKEMLGHGSVTSTEVYAKVSLDKKIQAVSLTDGMFG